MPVANKPILFYGIEHMAAAGNHRYWDHRRFDEPEIEEIWVTAAGIGVQITYIHQDSPLGLAHCVLIAR